MSLRPDAQSPAAGRTEHDTGSDPTGSEVTESDGANDAAHEAFVEYARTEPGSPRCRELREWLVNEYTPVAHHIAQRFGGRGQPDDDLRQVALLGLVNAVNRFDPERGSEFLAFAVPTIMGEVRRYFRDKTWAVRVPRRLQLLRMSISRAAEELSQELGSAPDPEHLASRLGISKQEVYEGLAASNAYKSASLDKESAVEGEGAPLREMIGDVDPDLERVELHETLEPLLAELPERERRIVVLRFFQNCTQTQIAADVGISQMHVSRLLTKTLKALRGRITEE